MEVLINKAAIRERGKSRNVYPTCHEIFFELNLHTQAHRKNAPSNLFSEIYIRLSIMHQLHCSRNYNNYLEIIYIHNRNKNKIKV